MSLQVENSVRVVPAEPLKSNIAGLAVKKAGSTAAATLKQDSLSIPANRVGASSENPFDLSNEGRKVMMPTGKSNGQNFYFLYTLEKTFDKIVMRTPNKLMVQDDIARLRNKGYTVIIDNKTTPEDFKNAVYDQKASGVVFLGHGAEGTLVTFASNPKDDVDFVTHWDIDKKKVGKNLKMVYLQACQAGTEEKNWEKALGTDVIAWTKSVTNLEVLAANAHIAAAGIFPVVGAVFSVMGQVNNKALGKLVSDRF